MASLQAEKPQHDPIREANTQHPHEHTAVHEVKEMMSQKMVKGPSDRKEEQKHKDVHANDAIQLKSNETKEKKKKGTKKEINTASANNNTVFIGKSPKDEHKVKKEKSEKNQKKEKKSKSKNKDDSSNSSQSQDEKVRVVGNN